MAIIWIIYLLLCIHFNKVFAVRCYICQSETDPACGDIFTVSADNPDLVQNCWTSCFKFVASRGDYRAISRGCMPSLKAVPHCKGDRRGDLYGEFCACQDDLCNATTTTRSSRWIHLQVLTVSILVLLLNN